MLRWGARGLAQGELYRAAAVLDAVHQPFIGEGFQGAVHRGAVRMLERFLYVSQAEGGRVRGKHVQDQQAHGRGSNLLGDECIFERMGHGKQWLSRAG